MSRTKQTPGRRGPAAIKGPRAAAKSLPRELASQTPVKAKELTEEPSEAKPASQVSPATGASLLAARSAHPVACSHPHLPAGPRKRKSAPTKKTKKAPVKAADKPIRKKRRAKNGMAALKCVSRRQGGTG